MDDKPLAWLVGTPQTPPFSEDGRLQIGYLLWLLQKGELPSMPHSRPMRALGARVCELRVKDEKAKKTWRLVYRIDEDAIVVAECFDKNDNRTPKRVITTVKERLRRFDAVTKRRT